MDGKTLLFAVLLFAGLIGYVGYLIWMFAIRTRNYFHARRLLKNGGDIMGFCWCGSGEQFHTCHAIKTR